MPEQVHFNNNNKRIIKIESSIPKISLDIVLCKKSIKYDNLWKISYQTTFRNQMILSLLYC